MSENPINKILHLFGLRLTKTKTEIRKSKIPKEFMINYNRNLTQLKKNANGLNVFKDFRYDVGIHPKSPTECQCEFVTRHLSKLTPPLRTLDIGSHRQFILGLLAHHQLTTIDVRERKSDLDNETIVTCDAKNLNLPDDEFDVVTSICSLAHFGLGRYGDEFNPNADKEAFKEMIRVLKPGGHLIFTTTITRAKPSIAFNAYRIYSYEMIREFCSNLICIEEKFYSCRFKKLCSLEEITTEPKTYDIYCGCWKKK